MSATTQSAPPEAIEHPTADRQSEQSKFVQHLATYPAITALAGLIASFPVAKIFVSNAVPLLHAIHERSRPVADPLAERAVPILRKLDDAGDRALGQVDRRFPQLKTVQPGDVYEGAQHYVDTARDNAATAYDNRITKPLSNATRAVKDQYEHVYGTQVAPRVAPLNDKLESAIDHYLPSPEGTVTGKNGSELARTYRLAYTAAERSVPKVRDVYSEKLEEQTHGKANPGYIAKLLAALATGTFLSQEAYAFVLGHFGSPEKLKNAVDEVRVGILNDADRVRIEAGHATSEAENAVEDAVQAASESFHHEQLKLQRDLPVE